MNHVLLIFISVFIVSLISLVGALFLALDKNRLKAILLDMVSFSAGALFANAIIHLLPEAFEESSQLWVGSITLLGVLVFFIIEKFIHCHHDALSSGLNQDNHIKVLGITNLLGDILHNTVDGMAIAASFLFSPELGISTTIAIIAHEIPKEAANFGVLLHAGFSVRKALFFNFLTALCSFLGAFIIIILHSKIDNLKYFLVPFTAGSFLYIAGTDLLPELHKNCSLKDTARHTLWLAAGMGIMILLSLITGVHTH